jgi:non-specific serine/threonine protein kinase
MTGTPVENSTTDLYAQMQFANPGMLGSLASFKRNFVKPIEQESNQEIADYLERTLDPFILRRTKEQVAKELPPKTEDIIYCTMPNDQRKIYDYWKDHYSNKIKNQVQSEGITKSKIHILEAITKLRQICASPRLLDSNQDSSFYEWGGVADAPGVGSGEVGGSANAHEVGSGEGSLTLPEWGVESGEAFTLPMGKKTAQDEEQSVKINEILLHIQEKTGKHQLIIFSQFVKMLELIRTELEKIDIPYAWLTGDSTLKSRQENVNRFQNDNTCRVFLISLRAGGAGLNLTAADYVYILDPWWNPAVENQAIDRCYRIGQDKNVFAYRMICKDTIEEKILELQQRKQNLSGQVVKVDERELIELIIKKE